MKSGTGARRICLETIKPPDSLLHFFVSVTAEELAPMVDDARPEVYAY
jgi:hypothetical protein